MPCLVVVSRQVAANMPFLVGADVDSRFATAVSAEFLGTLLFQFLGGVGGSSIANGLSYAVLGELPKPL